VIAHGVVVARIVGARIGIVADAKVHLAIGDGAIRASVPLAVTLATVGTCARAVAAAIVFIRAVEIFARIGAAVGLPAVFAPADVGADAKAEIAVLHVPAMGLVAVLALPAFVAEAQAAEGTADAMIAIAIVFPVVVIVGVVFVIEAVAVVVVVLVGILAVSVHVLIVAVAFSIAVDVGIFTVVLAVAVNIGVVAIQNPVAVCVGPQQRVEGISPVGCLHEVAAAVAVGILAKDESQLLIGQAQAWRLLGKREVEAVRWVLREVIGQLKVGAVAGGGRSLGRFVGGRGPRRIVRRGD
jgi:hypothetical protein